MSRKMAEKIGCRDAVNISNCENPSQSPSPQIKEVGHDGGN